MSAYFAGGNFGLIQDDPELLAVDLDEDHSLQLSR